MIIIITIIKRLYVLITNIVVKDNYKNFVIHDPTLLSNILCNVLNYSTIEVNGYD